MEGRVDRDMLGRLEREAVRELLHYHEKSKKQQIKELIKKAAGRYVFPGDRLFWPVGLLANMLAEHLGQWEEEETVLSSLRAVFDRWIRDGMPIYFMDDILSGMALLTLFERTGEGRYRKGADRMAEYLLELSKEAADEKGSIPYRPAQGNGHIYVDGIGMICPFLARYGRLFGQKQAVELAVCQIENMLDYGMDERTGLPYHGFRYEDGIKYGIIGWGRAVGWLLLGLSGTLRYLAQEAPSYVRLEEAFWRLVEAVLPWQRENGSFSWQMEALEGPEDSSAAGMIAAAVGCFLKHKRPAVPEGDTGQIKKEERLQKGELLVMRAAAYIMACEKDGRIRQASGECEGFSQYPQVYGAYPWSLAPGLGVLAGLRGNR
ncbi:MAG: glycoside hydrolase family 88 protein [Kineothrix sp.]